MSKFSSMPPKWGAMSYEGSKHLHWGVIKTLHAYPGVYVMECRHPECKNQAHAIPIDQFHVFGFILPFETTIENIERIKRERER